MTRYIHVDAIGPAGASASFSADGQHYAADLPASCLWDAWHFACAQAHNGWFVCVRLEPEWTAHTRVFYPQ